MDTLRSTLRLGIIVSIFLSTVSVMPGVPPTAHAAAKGACKTVKKHGKKVRICKGKRPAASIPIHPSGGLPSLTVSPQPDTSRAVTKTIPADGGSISATGTDGTVYTLTFPKDSLVADQEITMTPLSGVAMLPGGHSLAGGVQLDPQGLELAQPATLTIKLAHSIPAQNQISFAAEDSGADYHLYPQTYDSQTVTMQVMHFTEYGTFGGAASDLFTQMKHGTLSYVSLSEQMQAMLTAMRHADLTGTQSPYSWDAVNAKAIDMFKAWYTQKVLPGMQLAVDPNADDDQMSQAIQEALQWERDIQLLGDADNADLEADWTAVQGMIQQALTNAYLRAYNRCVSGHDVSAAARMGQVEHYIQSMGYDLGPSHNAIDDLIKCLHFELDVDATYTSQSSGYGTTVSTTGHVQVAALSLTLEPYLRFLQGSKQIDYLQFDASGGNSGCTVNSGGTSLGDPFVAQLALLTNPGTVAKGSPPAQPKLQLLVQPGTAKEHVHVSCPEGHYDIVLDYSQFTGLWDDAHGIGHAFSNWTILGGATYAKYTSGTKTFTYNVGGDAVVYTMSVTLTLRHTPG